MKNSPIGTQSFSTIRTENFLYVDKTEDIYRTVTNVRVCFLSCPHRFGKSLMISTLEALFRGQKELFEGLYIYDKWDWTKPYPVIRIDWTAIKHGTPEEIERSLSTRLKRLAYENEITLFSGYASDCFEELIVELHRKTGQKVVVLVDEYDVPTFLVELLKKRNNVESFLQPIQAKDAIFSSYDPERLGNGSLAVPNRLPDH